MGSAWLAVTGNVRQRGAMGGRRQQPVAFVTGASHGMGRGVAAVARELGVLDVDGRSPSPFSIETP